MATCLTTSQVAQLARTSPEIVRHWRHVGRSVSSAHAPVVAGTALTGNVCGSAPLAVMTPWVAVVSTTLTTGTDAKSFPVGRRSVARLTWLRRWQVPAPIDVVLRPPDLTPWPWRWPEGPAPLESSCCPA